MITGTVSKPLMLDLVLADRAANKFPRVRIVDSNGVQVGPVIAMTPSPSCAWLYQAPWTPLIAGHFSAVYDVFHDAGFTALTTHAAAVDHVRIMTDYEFAIQKILAHQGENVRDEMITPDPATGRPLVARRKIYATKADALADLNPIATVDVTANYPSPASWSELVRVLQ